MDDYFKEEDATVANYWLCMEESFVSLLGVDAHFSVLFGISDVFSAGRVKNIVWATEEERELIEEKMQQIQTINL